MRLAAVQLCLFLLVCLFSCLHSTACDPAVRDYPQPVPLHLLNLYGTVALDPFALKAAIHFRAFPLCQCSLVAARSS
jgi:hypothetical protein